MQGWIAYVRPQAKRDLPLADGWEPAVFLMANNHEQAETGMRQLVLGQKVDVKVESVMEAPWPVARVMIAMAIVSGLGAIQQQLAQAGPRLVR
ncbi:MAG: hypothetical protein ACRD0K_10110 [Egibacteraceae bacterium]